MDFEEQLLIGGLLMTIAVLSASHAHARPAAAARSARAAAIVGVNAQNTPPMAAIKDAAVQEGVWQIIQPCQTCRAG